MLIAGVLCLCAAIAAAALGLWTLSRPHTADPAHRVRQAIAPTQLAASVMLGAGGTVALAAGARTGPLVLIVCVLGAIGTVAAGLVAGCALCRRTRRRACAVQWQLRVLLPVLPVGRVARRWQIA